mmetsp:Transcript_90961/g.253142  ORF Transcript_90961/g.253142 Transcript_90961/m.253142 type:complete len:237 (-) Transcript_90961:622-1332(-)
MAAPWTAEKKTRASQREPHVSAMTSTNGNSSGMRKATRQATRGSASCRPVATTEGPAEPCPCPALGHAVASTARRGREGQNGAAKARSLRMARRRTSSNEAAETSVTVSGQADWSRQLTQSMRWLTATSMKVLALTILPARHSLKAHVAAWVSCAAAQPPRWPSSPTAPSQTSTSTMARNIGSKGSSKSAPRKRAAARRRCVSATEGQLQPGSLGATVTAETTGVGKRSITSAATE